MPADLDLVDVLKLLAKRYRGRVAGLNLYDPNVCTSTFDWREAVEVRPVPLDRFRHRLKMKYKGQPMEIYSNNHFIAVSARGTFGSAVPFSINRRDRIMLLDRRCQVAGAKRWRVYVDEDAGIPDALRQQRVLRAIERLELGRHDSLHVYGNGLTVYVRPASADRIVDVIAVMATLASYLQIAAKPATEFRDLPNQFRPLVKLMKAWSWSDDQERSDRLAKAPRERLQRMVNEVEPHFRSINAYLDGFGAHAISESAAALGTLAEAASEAQSILKGRDRSGLRRSAHQGHRKRRKLRSS